MPTDAVELPELTERQERILALIIREYVNKPEPVSSKTLTEQYLPNLSSATVRNDMSALEEAGMISAPHTSAGRIPTDAGYRYFVTRLLKSEQPENELSSEEKSAIADAMTVASNDVEAWMRVAVSSLAKTSRGAAIVTAPLTIATQYKHLALLSVHGRMVMMVLVMHGGQVRQQMLTLSEPLTQDILSAAANRLNARCEGLDADQLRALSRTAETQLDRELLDLVARALSERDNAHLPITYRDGLMQLLPELTDSGAAQQALRVMEEQTLLSGLLGEPLDQQVGDVHVIIAGDGRWQEVKHLSFVFSRYGVDGQSVGSLAVLGPTRMRYGRAISAVRYVAGLLSNRLEDMFGAEPSDRSKNEQG